MKIVTWNMQGNARAHENKWNTDVSRLILAGADILCLQECGGLPESAVKVDAPDWLPGYAASGGIPVEIYHWQVGTRLQSTTLMIVYAQTDPMANEKNLALVVSLDSAIPVNLIAVPNNIFGGRPALGARVRDKDGAIADYYTIHAISPGGPDAPGLINGIVGVGAANWFAGGDYNRIPETWDGIVPAGTALCSHASVSTPSGLSTNRNYAFAQAGAMYQGVVDPDFIVSDHYPVSYQL